MTDAVTNLEAEDVLSSIRRLIADVPEEEPVVERLVLTAAQRVDQPGEPAPQTNVRPLLLNNPIAPEPELVLPAVAADAPSEPQPPAAEDLGPDDSALSESDLVLARAAAFFGRPASTDHSFVDRRNRLENTIAELEAAIAGTPEQWEPDGTEAGSDALPLAEEAQQRSDAPAEPPAAELPAQASTTSVAPKAEAAGLPVDEAQLRAMISAALRDELRGPLGDRITQNVRKLVRSEIYRIITTEELE